MSREIVFWSVDRDLIELTATSIADALEDWVDLKTFNPVEDDPIELPTEVTVYGFARMELEDVEFVRRSKQLLPMLLESLDEEYGNPYTSNWTTATEQMIEAERQFIQTVLDNYEPWYCEVVEEKTVYVPDYVNDLGDRFVWGNGEAV